MFASPGFFQTYIDHWNRTTIVCLVWHQNVLIFSLAILHASATQQPLNDSPVKYIQPTYPAGNQRMDPLICAFKNRLWYWGHVIIVIVTRFETDCREWRTWLDRTYFFRVRYTSFRIHSPLLTFFFCFIVLFHTYCSNAQVFGKILVHEFLFCIAILNGTCSLRAPILLYGDVPAIKQLNYKQTNWNALRLLVG